MKKLGRGENWLIHLTKLTNRRRSRSGKKELNFSFENWLLWKYIGRPCLASLKNIGEWIHFIEVVGIEELFSQNNSSGFFWVLPKVRCESLATAVKKCPSRLPIDFPDKLMNSFKTIFKWCKPTGWLSISAFE